MFIKLLHEHGFDVLAILDRNTEAASEFFSGYASIKRIVLVGNSGPELWQHFVQSPESADGAPDPLDRYTRRTLSDVAHTCSMPVVFSFEGPPFLPFQRWALASGGFSQSPLGVLVDHYHGPWAAFRAAFLVTARSTFARTILDEDEEDGPCPACREKPCLTACPVDAISEDKGYDVARCASWLSENPQADCHIGCRARRACPYGQEDAHEPDQARLHMRAFCTMFEDMKP